MASWISWNLSFCYIHCTGQFTPKMKANAESRLLSSLVWIDQHKEYNRALWRHSIVWRLSWDNHPISDEIKDPYWLRLLFLQFCLCCKLAANALLQMSCCKCSTANATACLLQIPTSANALLSADHTKKLKAISNQLLNEWSLGFMSSVVTARTIWN